MSINWQEVERVLLIRLRSIGDTVLSTPSLIALRRFLPNAQIDILLEDWVAPVLDGFSYVDNVIRIGGSSGSRSRTALELRKRKYDVVFNLHGGSTSSFLTFAMGATQRVGYKSYQFSFIHNHQLSSSADFWGREKTHSAEQQLALLGSVGVPVDDRPKTELAVTEEAISSLEEKFRDRFGIALAEIGRGALIHPAAAFATKQWATENFAKVADRLAGKGFTIIAVAAGHEAKVLTELTSLAHANVLIFSDMTLPEITALASRASLFVGNDSGIAHIAAAVGTPSVIIFGSSNRAHWHPWTDAPNQVVFEEFPCQPCPGYTCEVFGDPKCILSVKPASVIDAIERLI